MMGGATKGLQLVTDIERRRHHTVWQMLRNGYSPNLNYMGVIPLNLAVENGDPDMVALLLKAGADINMKANKSTTARELAEQMRDDPKCQYRAEAAVCLEILDDPQKLEARMETLMEKIKADHKAEGVLLANGFKAFFAFLAVGLLSYFFYFKDLDVEEGNKPHHHGGDI